MDQLCEWWKNNKPNKLPSLEQIRSEIIEAVVDGCLEYGYDVCVSHTLSLSLRITEEWTKDKQQIVEAIESCEDECYILLKLDDDKKYTAFICLGFDVEEGIILDSFFVEDNHQRMLTKALELIDKYEGEL